MAKGIGNLILQNISGKIGKNLVIKQYADKIVISAYAHPTSREPAPIQEIYRSRFTEAVKYARQIMHRRDPEGLEIKKNYEQLLKPNQRLYNYLVAEYMHQCKEKDRLWNASQAGTIPTPQFSETTSKDHRRMIEG